MLSCRITSVQGTEEYDSLDSVVLPELSGQMQILTGHAETFLLLTKGNIDLIQAGRKIKTIPLLEGACHVLNNLVTVVL